MAQLATAWPDLTRNTLTFKQFHAHKVGRTVLLTTATTTAVMLLSCQINLPQSQTGSKLIAGKIPNHA